MKRKRFETGSPSRKGNVELPEGEEQESDICPLRNEGVNLLVQQDQTSSLSQADQSCDNLDSDSLIDGIGRDNLISCLIRCTRADLGSIACLNRNFRSLVQSGDLYKKRRQACIVEHWVYFSCYPGRWEAFDPTRLRWMSLPTMPPDQSFLFSDKVSLAVGTQLLIFGKNERSYGICMYNLLRNTWSFERSMNVPRFLFASHSLREIAIVAGGVDNEGNILSSAELYNSETGNWHILPSMHKPRKRCIGVFMDEKFYVIGGIGVSDSELTCGEEYNLETGTWTEIPNMSPRHAALDRRWRNIAPHMITVVENELYVCDCIHSEIRKYEKRDRAWVVVGKMPPSLAYLRSGMGFGFRGCGHQLLCIGGPRVGSVIEVYSWVPNEDPVEWNLLSQKQSNMYILHTCTVMGC